MSKRRRASSAASHVDDEGLTEESTPEPVPTTGRKRRKPDPSELCRELYDSIRNFKKEDGSMLCDSFIRAPKRRQEPSYYEVVTNPIDLLRVQQKLKTDTYEDVEELSADVELLVKNAKAFYKPDSIEYQDACALWDMFLANKSKLLDSIHEDMSESRTKAVRVGRQPRKSATNEADDISETSNDDFDAYEELFTAVMTATDPVDNHAMHIEFQLLPSKKLYPDYYDIIEHPIDLKLIGTKIQTSAYTSLSEMEKDLMQMTRNACMFNEPGSQIYKDAKNLKKIFVAKKLDLESGKVKSTRPKRRGTSLSAMAAALKEEVDTSDDEIDATLDPESDGPMWQLFDQLYNTANNSDPNAPGAPLGESLWKLPNRRFHPEYYVQIMKPISMAQIRNKLKKGVFANITEMTADLYLMIDNAKKAFPSTHKTHKDAVRMQKILNQKLVDTGADQEDSELEDGEVSLGTAPSTASTTNSSPTTPIPGAIKKKGRPPRINPIATVPIPTPVLTQAVNVMSYVGTPKGRFPNNPVLKKKLLGLQRFLTEYAVAGRRPMTLFMEKPSKKQYPDYYEVIKYPIDMNTIEMNIKTDRYGTVDDVVGDYRLMFSNCRKYNEEGSMIYDDANILERALNEKLKEFSSMSDRRSTPKVMKIGKKVISPLENKLRQLYDTIRDYRVPKMDRQLALIFMKLPSKNDYPDYYDIIKNPIDMEKISHKLKQQGYESVDDMASEFMLMFENACKYNEPDSQIYKDALILQQVCIQTKQLLKEASDETIPDVPQAVQELLVSLFTIFYNHQDEDGRCFSDSLAELIEYDDIDGAKVRAISLDLIKRRLDKGLYKRLDIFQEDVFACLDRARRLSRTDSQVFEDSIELQSFFIKKRDELCRNGEILSSPALSYSAMHLSAAVEAVRQSKLLQEEQEQENEHETPQTQGESMTIDQKVYSPGDFVYYDAPDNKIPGIAYIERLWTTTDNVKMMFGSIFLRPHETYHVTTRKFLEQEVFKSDQHQAMPMSQLQLKCHVMSVRDYIKYKPEGFASKDVYVCESRYNTKPRSFKKMKTWPFIRLQDPVKLVQRETTLDLKRIMSVFKERVEKHKGELAELQLQEALVEKEKPNVVVFLNGSEEESTYYEQFNTICSGVVKTGDYVYVATESGKQSIAQISSIWETKDGKSFFRGPWLLTPPEVLSLGTKLFYRQEVLLSTVQDTNPTVAIVGRCAVLEYQEYISCRPTEIPESDIYICESIYDEVKKHIRRMTNSGLRKFTHSQMVTPDEIYHFKRPITPIKASSNEIAALQDSLKHATVAVSHPAEPVNQVNEVKTETVELLSIMEDSMDGGPPSVGSDLVATASPASCIQVVTPLVKKPKTGKKIVTGYILYSSEVRKATATANPDATFGDISRIVGNEWRSLSITDKQIWEEKAGRLNEENAAKAARIAEEAGCASPAPELASSQIFECCWDKCDFQFEDVQDCLEHCVSDGTVSGPGHVQNHFTAIPTSDNVYHCLWRNCIRLKKQAPPFPHLQRLVKHVREVHINKSGGRNVLLNDRSKNYTPSKVVVTPTVPAVVSTTVSIQIPPQTIQAALTMESSPVLSSQGAPHLSMKLNRLQNFVQSKKPIHIVQTTGQNPHQIQIGPTPTLHIIASPPAEPLFVTVPPRPQRVLHSEAYIKYIEGLQNDSRFISPWEKTIRANQEIVPAVDAVKLPLHWLGSKAQQNPDEVVNALWQLRHFMMKDVLQIQGNQF